MKFALVLPHLAVGGAQKQAGLLLQDLSARGHTVRFALSDPNSRLAKDRFAMLKQLDIDPSLVLARKSRVNLMALFSIFYDLVGRHKLARRDKEEVLFRQAAELLVVAIGWPLLFVVHRNVRIRLTRRGAGQADSRSAMRKRPTLLLRADHLAKLLTRWEPDAIVSFLTQSNISSILATPAQYPVAICERNDVLRQTVDPKIGVLRAKTYPNATLIMANSPHVVTDLGEMFPDSHVQWFPNAFPSSVSPRDVHQKTLGMLCRMESQKNVRLVVDAFLESSARRRGWKLIIFGDGPERDSITELVDHGGAESGVELRGSTSNPTQALEEIDVFVSASDYEGSSNSIHEAVASGSVPLVASTIGEYREIVPQRLLRATSFSLTEESLRKRLDAVSAEEATLTQLRQNTRTHFERYWVKGREVRESLLTELEQLAQKP